MSMSHYDIMFITLDTRCQSLTMISCLLPLVRGVDVSLYHVYYFRYEVLMSHYDIMFITSGTRCWCLTMISCLLPQVRGVDDSLWYVYYLRYVVSMSHCYMFQIQGVDVSTAEGALYLVHCTDPHHQVPQTPDVGQTRVTTRIPSSGPAIIWRRWMLNKWWTPSPFSAPLRQQWHAAAQQQQHRLHQSFWIIRRRTGWGVWPGTVSSEGG